MTVVPPFKINDVGGGGVMRRLCECDVPCVVNGAMSPCVYVLAEGLPASDPQRYPLTCFQCVCAHGSDGGWCWWWSCVAWAECCDVSATYCSICLCEWGWSAGAEQPAAHGNASAALVLRLTSMAGFALTSPYMEIVTPSALSVAMRLDG
jgi:hypothetical protein